MHQAAVLILRFAWVALLPPAGLASPTACAKAMAAAQATRRRGRQVRLVILFNERPLSSHAKKNNFEKAKRNLT